MNVLFKSRHKYRERRLQEIKDFLYKLKRVLRVSPREFEEIFFIKEVAE